MHPQPQLPSAKLPRPVSTFPSARMIQCVIAGLALLLSPLRSRAECQSDNDCKYGRQCIQGVCTPEQPCSNDKQCPGNLVCTNAHCMIPLSAPLSVPQAAPPAEPSAPAPQAAPPAEEPPSRTWHAAPEASPPPVHLLPEPLRVSPEERAAAMLNLKLRDPAIASAAREQLSSVGGYQVGGWILLAIGQIMNLSALGTLLADGTAVNAPASLSFVSTVAFTIGGPVAAGGGMAARDGLDLLGLDQDGHGFRSTGWVFYGISLGLNSLAAVFDCVAISNQSNGDAVTGVALGVTAGALSLVSIILLEADASEAHHQLARALNNRTPVAPPQAATSAVVDRQLAANLRPAASGAGYGFAF